MSLQDSNQRLFTLQCLLSTSNDYPDSLFPERLGSTTTPRFSGPDSMPPASSFVSPCKQRQIQSRHRQFPKVNFSFGNQFPFRNQVQTVLAWAVKGGDTGKCGWKALTSKAVTEFSEECAFLKPLQTQSSFHRYDHTRSANNQAIQTHPVPNTAWIVVTDGFPPINVKHPEFSI